MLWVFDRDGEQLRYEIRRDDNGTGYMLVMTSTNGHRQVQKVEQPTDLIERSLEELRRLKDDGWRVG